MDQDGVAQRLELLRAELARQDLDGFIVPHGDEFQNEQLPPSAERLAWITGFTGSAGSAVILKDRAVLFVDGRYTLQAAAEVPSALFEAAHRVDETPEAWLARNLPSGARLGYDPWLHTPRQVDALQQAVEKAGATLTATEANPLHAVWRNRPIPPATPVVRHSVEYAGESSADKRARLAQGLKDRKLDTAVLTDPASIAWLLNVRGADVPCTPLTLSFAFLHADGQVDWFIDPTKLNGLALDGVRAQGFGEFAQALRGLNGRRVLADPAVTASAVFDGLQAVGAAVERGADPCRLPKSCKNEVQLAGVRAAHRRDGLALVKFLAWLDRNTDPLTELDVIARLEAFRAEDPLYRGPSFETIAGSGPNGAIVHYRASEASNRALDSDSLLLLDSGAQYEDGTTDITRTVALGTPAYEMREMFTRVLKGHIALATARFPKGTSGLQLDALARQFLWAGGANYDHGTGHGVGFYLSVHEGPQRISAKAEPVPLEPGMILSNEPGYYQTGAYGIRIENLIAVGEGQDGYLEFETLSLAPIDRRCMVIDMLSRAERHWLTGYHLRVRATLLPELDGDTARWLDEATTPV